MFYYFRNPAIWLAALLQLLPLYRTLCLNPAVGNSCAFILRWGIGAAGVLGAYDSVSRASSAVEFSSPTNFSGTVGNFFSNNVTIVNNQSDPGAYFVLTNLLGSTEVTPGPLTDGLTTTVCLPPGLTFKCVDKNNGGSTQPIYGAIYGTPTTAATDFRIHISAGHPAVGPSGIISTDIFFTILSSASAPTIAAQPTGLTNAAGSTAHFTVTANGAIPLSYQWLKDGNPLADGGNLTGSGTNRLTLANLVTNDSGNYSVIITNALGSVTSSIVALSVILPPTILAQPQSLVTAAGSSAALNVVADGPAPLTYRWLKNGGSLADGIKFSGTSSNVLTLANLATNDSGGFSVVVANQGGAITSSVATVTVLLPLKFTMQASNRAVRLGTNTFFRAAVSGTAPFTFQWFKDSSPITNGGDFSGVNSNILAVAVTSTNDSGNYSLFVSNAVSTITSSNALLTTLVRPVILTQPTNQTVIVSNSAAFAVAVDGTAPFRYQWEKSALVKGKTAITVIKGATNSIFSLISAKTNDAAGYFVVINNSAGISTSSVASLTVLVPASFTLQASNRAAKLGTNTYFVTTVKGTAPFAYQWFKDNAPLMDGGNISGANSNILAVTALTTNDNGSYALIASNAVNTITSSNALLTVLLPPVIIVAPTNQSVVVSNSVAFAVVVDGTAPFRYQWKKSALVKGKTTITVIKGATNSIFSLPAAKITDAANYFVVITNRAGSVTSSNVTLTVLTVALAMKATTLSTITTPPTAELKISCNADGSMTLSLTGEPNTNYSLQAADDIATPLWQTMGSGVSQPNGAWQLTDTNIVGSPLRFYRVIKP